LSRAFFTPNFQIAIAASPPVEVALPAIRAAVVMHIGHMVSPLVTCGSLIVMQAGEVLKKCSYGWNSERPGAKAPC
jgi:hypothetical protein